MKLHYDIDGAVAAYASSFGNNEKRLIEWCTRNNATQYMDEIKSITNAIEEAIKTEIFNGNVPITADEMLEKIHKKCEGLDLGIGRIGMVSLLEHVAWFSWHEGYLKGNFNRSTYE